MSKELTAFRKICKNLNSYEFTDEYKKGRKLIEKSLKALQIIKNRILIDEDMGVIETEDEPSFGKVAHLHSITFQILSDEEDYDLLNEVLKK